MGNLWPVESVGGSDEPHEFTHRPGQDAVRVQIKSVVCDYDAKRSIMLKDGTLEFKSDFTSGDE